MQKLANEIGETENTKKINCLYIGNQKVFLDNLSTSNQTHEVTFYEDPIVAYNFLIKKQVDIIFCDVNIDSIELFYFLKKIKSIIPVSTNVILITTKNLTSSFLNDARLLGVKDIIHSSISTFAIDLRLKTLIRFSKNKDVDSISVFSNPLEFRINFFKRAFDVIFSSLALLLLSPILVVVASLIKLDSKGPVFFISKRVGTGFKIFDFYKFRSMKTGAENLIDGMKDNNQYKLDKKLSITDKCPECEQLGYYCSPVLFVDGAQVCESFSKKVKADASSSFMKFKNDPRVTPLGQFLRKSSIDELPQLINILKGDMSFVGNRPLPIYEAEQLTSDQWSLRFNAPAGLTGLWQVTKRGKSDMSEEERKELDNSYAKENSLFGDIHLILKTIPALTQKESV